MLKRKTKPQAASLPPFLSRLSLTPSSADTVLSPSPFSLPLSLFLSLSLSLSFSLSKKYVSHSLFLHPRTPDRASIACLWHISPTSQWEVLIATLCAEKRKCWSLSTLSLKVLDKKRKKYKEMKKIKDEKIADFIIRYNDEQEERILLLESEEFEGADDTNRSVSAGHSPVIQVKRLNESERGGESWKEREAHFLIPSLHPCPKNPENESTDFLLFSLSLHFSLLSLNYYSSSFSFILSSPPSSLSSSSRNREREREWNGYSNFTSLKNVFLFLIIFRVFEKGLSLSLLPVSYNTER